MDNGEGGFGNGKRKYPQDLVSMTNCNNIKIESTNTS
jgi:hypothetical protein